MTKSKIAVLIAVMLAVPAAVAQVEQAQVETSSETIAVTEMSTQPAAESSAQPAEPIVQAEASVTSEAPVAQASAPRAPHHFNFGHAFPAGAESEYSYAPLPALVAYWDRMEQQRRHFVARGDAFAQGAESEYSYQPLPALVAHWDGIERQRIARASAPRTPQPAPVTTSEAPSAQPERVASAADSSSPTQ